MSNVNVKVDEPKPATIKIKWNGKTPRTFELPIPFLTYSEETGKVTCDPIGEFPLEDGKRLLEIAPELAERVE